MPFNTWLFHSGMRGQTVVRNPRALRVSGPILNVEIHVPSPLAKYLAERRQPIPQAVKGLALFDTGATHARVDSHAISQLGVEPVGRITTFTAAGPTKQSLFPARLLFPNPKMRLTIDFDSVVGVNLRPFIVRKESLLALVGRDVLSRCVLIYNGPGASYTVGF